jgi:DeoR/GlpR family transcriptional regulator of sugar metabolism
MEGGTTVTSMAQFLNPEQQLAVVTNGYNTISALKQHIPQTSVLCCGGMLRDISYTFVGQIAEQFFAQIHAQTVFLSASGITLEQGFTDPNMLEGQVKKAMSLAARQKVMLIDADKFGKLSLLTTFKLEEIDVIITNEGAPADMLDKLRNIGIDVQIVK